jgi:putative peptide zinc metalloprotease protein
MRKRFLLLLLVLLTALGPAAGTARADDANGNGDDNAAVAINLKDGASVFRFAFELRQTMNDVVDSTNAAVAYSQCENCRTVALAVQVVLVASDPSVVMPENVAVAVNYECTSCETFAAAYQFVIGTDGPVEFTTAGRTELNRIRKELRFLIREDLPFDELQARIDELMDRLRWVLDNELVPADGDGDDDEGENEGEKDGSANTTEGSNEDDATSTEPNVSTDTGTTETETTMTETTETGTTETDTTGTTTTGG